MKKVIKMHESLDRVYNRINRSQEPIAVIALGGRLKTMLASELPKTSTHRLIGVYDPMHSNLIVDANSKLYEWLEADILWAEKTMVEAA